LDEVDVAVRGGCELEPHELGRAVRTELEARLAGDGAGGLAVSVGQVCLERGLRDGDEDI